MNDFSLDELRRIVKKTQEEEESGRPNNPTQQIVVGSDAKIRIGDPLNPGENVTEVEQKIFALRQQNG